MQVPASAFARYGDRDNTVYEHLDEIRRTCQFRECGWREYLWLARELLPHAMESDRPVPLIEQALELLRAEGIIAPGLTHLERLVWIVLKAAEKRLFRLLTGPPHPGASKPSGRVVICGRRATRNGTVKLATGVSWSDLGEKCQADCGMVAVSARVGTASDTPHPASEQSLTISTQV
ncbi:MAG: hypothetical protein NVS4B11_11570 [Ktedonobacteraceae bacterium]